LIAGLGSDTLSGGAGNDTFVFAKGQAAGDIITDFQGNGTAAGDSLQLTGFSHSSYLTHSGANWTIHDGSYAETFTLTGVTTLAADDFHFI
jgi:Ca2+-binding RTX toxin-like protein